MPKRCHLMPAQRVLGVRIVGSWEGWAGIRSSCVGWIGACLGTKGGLLARGGMRGFVFGMSGNSWDHDEGWAGISWDHDEGWEAGVVHGFLEIVFTALQNEGWEQLSWQGIQINI